MPLYRTPLPASDVEADLAGVRPGRASALSTSVLAHWAMFGTRARTIAGAYFAFDVWNACDADDEADEQQDREQRRPRDDRQEQPDQPEEADQRDDDARRQRVADPTADRLPAGMADVDRGRERAAQERADDGADAVGQQDVPEVVVVAGRRGALDVVHPLGEVVDTERDRGRQQRRDVGEAAEDLGRRASAGGCPNWANESPTAFGSQTRASRRRSTTSQPMTVPTMIAARPPGMPNGRRTPAVHDSMTMAKVASAIHGALYIWKAALIEMNASEMPGQRPEHRGARRVAPDRRADERADQDDDRR